MTPGERLYEVMKAAALKRPDLHPLESWPPWATLRGSSRDAYTHAALQIVPDGRAVYEAWRRRADESGRVIVPWEALDGAQRRIWDGAADDLLKAKSTRRADGYYWVRGKDPQWPGVFVDRWTQDASSPGGGFWRDMGTNEVEVLAGPLEPPNGAG